MFGIRSTACLPASGDRQVASVTATALSLSGLATTILDALGIAAEGMTALQPYKLYTHIVCHVGFYQFCTKICSKTVLIQSGTRYMQ